MHVEDWCMLPVIAVPLLRVRVRLQRCQWKMSTMGTPFEAETVHTCNCTQPVLSRWRSCTEAKGDHKMNKMLGACTKELTGC